MNNIPQVLLSSLIQLRFNIEKNITYENQDDFVKANKYLDELQKTINELYQNKNFESSKKLSDNSLRYSFFCIIMFKYSLFFEKNTFCHLFPFFQDMI